MSINGHTWKHRCSCCSFGRMEGSDLCCGLANWNLSFSIIQHITQILSLLITEERCNYGHHRWLRHSSYLAVHESENIIPTEIRKLDWSDKCVWRNSRIISNTYTTFYLVCLLQSKKINKFPILNFPLRFVSYAYFHAFWWTELDIWELPLQLC